MAVILVSSDLPELIGMCDRIAVMRDGAITAIVDAAGLREDAPASTAATAAGAAAA